jgi:ATP synthase F1 delta subunit
MLDIATAEDAVPAYRAALDRLGALAPATLRLLGDPGMPLEKRLRAAEAATVGQPGPLRGLVAVLIRRDRIALLGRIAAAFGELVDERSGIAKAHVTTAIELDRSAREALVSRLSRATGKTIQATFTADPDLLGGARIQVGDHLVDASLSAQLRSLRQKLTSARGPGSRVSG